MPFMCQSEAWNGNDGKTVRDHQHKHPPHREIGQLNTRSSIYDPEQTGSPTFIVPDGGTDDFVEVPPQQVVSTGVNRAVTMPPATVVVNLGSRGVEEKHELRERCIEMG